MSGVVIKMDARFKRRLRVAFSGYTAEVGILQNKPHKLPVSASVAKKKAQQKAASSLIGAGTLSDTYRFKNFAGGKARRTSNKTEGTMASVSKSLRENTGINIYTRPWRDRKNKDIVRFTQGFVKLFLRGAVTKRRVENLLQAVVRNPILRGDYGRNSPVTAKIKGFNRFMIDTSQLFQNIKARVIRRARNV